MAKAKKENARSKNKNIKKQEKKAGKLAICPRPGQF